LTESLRRPALRWHGGKWKLAPWIISHFPTHRIYVEPFGGAASVLIRKSRSYGEIYNDLDQDVVNLFGVLRSDHAPRLIELLRLTPFARLEFEGAYLETEDPVERARRLIIRSFMGFGSDSHNRAIRTGFRANSNRSGTTPAHDWVNLGDCYSSLLARLSGVVVECRNAIDVMKQHDSAEALHYVDPPYLPETRSQKSRRGKVRYHAYAHEMTVEDHAELLAFLPSLQGAVVLSGYPAPLYDEALRDWCRVERPSHADGARPRTEVLWLNRACTERARSFFGGSAA
jgi:DNA adenine methylase